MATVPFRPAPSCGQQQHQPAKSQTARCCAQRLRQPPRGSPSPASGTSGLESSSPAGPVSVPSACCSGRCSWPKLVQGLAIRTSERGGCWPASQGETPETPGGGRRLPALPFGSGAVRPHDCRPDGWRPRGWGGGGWRRPATPRGWEAAAAALSAARQAQAAPSPLCWIRSSGLARRAFAGGVAAPLRACCLLESPRCLQRHSSASVRSCATRALPAATGSEGGPCTSVPDLASLPLSVAPAPACCRCKTGPRHPRDEVLESAGRAPATGQGFPSTRGGTSSGPWRHVGRGSYPHCPWRPSSRRPPTPFSCGRALIPPSCSTTSRRGAPLLRSCLALS